MKKLEKIFNIFDILSCEPKLNFDGKKKLSNSFTKIFSLILIVILLMIGLFLSSDFLNRSNPQISFIVESKTSIKLNKINKFIAFKLTDENNKILNDNFKIILKFNDNIKNKTQDFEYRKCLEEDLVNFKNERSFYQELKKLNLNQLICIPSKNLGKSPNSKNEIEDFTKYFQIIIYPKKKHRSILLNKTKIKMNFIYEDYIVKFEKNFEFKRILKEKVRILDFGAYIFDEVNYSSNIMNEDVGYITTFNKITEFVNIEKFSSLKKKI